MSGGNGGGLHNTGGSGGTGYTGQNGNGGEAYVLSQSGSNPIFYYGGGGGGGAGYNKAGSGGKSPVGGSTGGAGGTAGAPSSRNGGNGTDGGGGGAGYAGGTGSQHPFGFTSYSGGNGGNGGAGSNSPRETGGGGGGAGGAGFFTEKAATATMTFSASATGGAGGNGGVGPGAGATGGDGGAGLVDGVANASLTFAAGYTAKGGTGGSGAGGSSGGAGIVLYSASASADPLLTNNGTAIGGSGGASTSGTGGTGGAGVKFATTEGTFKNAGSVQGGNGGTGGAYGAGLVGAGLKVENNGSITGGGTGAAQADAITFQSGANTLALGTKSSISGAVDIQSGTLKFDQSALSGALTDASLAAPITGDGSVVKVGTGTLTLSMAGTYKGGTTLSAGALDLGAATAAGTGAITFGALSGTAQATLDIDAGAQSSGSTFANTLSGFNASSVLDLKGFVVTSTSYAGGTLTLDGTLTVNGTTTATSESYMFASPTSTAFTTTSDNAGGTDVMVCFTAGTCIRTARRDDLVEVAVEDLRLGDLVVTASGVTRPVKWLGHRKVDCRRHPHPREAMPIRVAAHAFGPNRPARDLHLSAGHSVCVDIVGGVLIPIGRLVNGATIRQLDVDSVTYWHVELESHDVLLAENLACESYIDCGSRAFFAESDVVALAASPDAPVLTTENYCRPFKPEGTLVDMVRDRLCLRAADLGWRLAVDDALAGLWLEVDGARIDPARHGLFARATLPADAREVRLRSASGVPSDIFGDRDERRLGLQLASLVIDDGLGCRREIACTDPRLADGFQPHEGAHRWTDGDARLPAALWEGCRDSFHLRLAFAGPALPRWVAPAEAGVAAARDVAA